jgi:hypothetical protein
MKKKIKGYALKSEITWYTKTPIGKDTKGTPIEFDVWKDIEDLKYCCPRMKVVAVTIIVDDGK